MGDPEGDTGNCILILKGLESTELSASAEYSPLCEG